MSPNHSRSVAHLGRACGFGVGLDHLACLGFEDFRYIVQKFALCGAVVLLAAEGAAVNLNALTGVVFGGYANCVFSGNYAVDVIPRTGLAFLDEQVELEGVLVLPGTRVDDFAALLDGFLLRASGRV